MSKNQEEEEELCVDEKNADNNSKILDVEAKLVAITCLEWSADKLALPNFETVGKEWPPICHILKAQLQKSGHMKPSQLKKKYYG